MTLAIHSTSTLLPPFTLPQFVTALTAAMASAGFQSTPIDTFSSSDNLTTNIVNQITFDATKTYGQVFHQVQITADTNTNLIINQRLASAWNAVSHSGSNVGQAPSVTGTTAYGYPIPLSGSGSPNPGAANVNFYSFNHPEIKMVLINQASNWFHIDLWRPATKLIPNLFDENIFPFAFVSSNDLSSFYNCSVNISPFFASGGSPDVYQMTNYPQLRYKLSVSNPPEIVRCAAPLLFTAELQGPVAQYSSDIGLIGSDSLNYLQEIINAGNTHVLLHPRGGISGITVASSPMS